jgi:hypothetical protein
MKPEGNRARDGTSHRWKDSIIMDVKEMCCEGLD